MADFRLDGKVAVVTGASQGIGLAISHALAQAGATIALTHHPDKRIDNQKACAEIAAAGGKAQGFGLDVAQTGVIRRVFNQIASELGSVDILVNNAGVRANGPSMDISEEHWDFVMGVNLKGTFFCSQAAATHMLRKGSGRIISIASQMAESASPERAAYIASKGGIVALTKTLALEWAAAGITVNAIGPGPTATPMTADSTPENESRILGRSPLGRRLTTDEIAGAVVFLAGPAATAITGQHLMVDGGWTAS